MSVPSRIQKVQCFLCYSHKPINNSSTYNLRDSDDFFVRYEAMEFRTMSPIHDIISSLLLVLLYTPMGHKMF